ncbi:TolC family protein [Rufibacter hautae]|uniref:TolC family protein n=2 Tax=Rufibacter hautae TaxID=2595005 RepID=A0A5B6T991_9BACT|nr:TolC family protein [Rufibacter hautae]
MNMKKISLALLLTLYGLVASAQTAPSKGADWEKKLFNSEYALPILIETALANAPELENADAARLASMEQRKIIRKNFYSGFSINSSYTYGSMNNWNTNGEPVNSFNAFDAPLRARYTMGLSMSLPLGQLLSRHNTIKNQDLAVIQAEGSKKLTEKAVRMRVINLYQNLKMAKNQLELQQQAYQTAVVSQEIAKKQFKSGEIMIDAMSNVQQAHTSAATALQTAKVNYETQLLMMEETIGTRLIDLIQSK